MGASQTLVLDTGPLSAFAQAGWLGALRGMAERAPYRLEVTAQVREELRAGLPGHLANQLVLDVDWIVVVDEEIERELFEEYAARLVSGRRNIGECSVLARAKACGSIAVVDDAAARRLADKEKVEHRGTLALLVETIRAGYLTLEAASDVADHLIAVKYRLPFQPGEFVVWARQNLGLE